jgi:hypothetical protein
MNNWGSLKIKQSGQDSVRVVAKKTNVPATAEHEEKSKADHNQF